MPTPKTKRRSTKVDPLYESKRLDDVSEMMDWGFGATNCTHCGIHNSEIEGTLIQCGKCKLAYYCSMKCFNADLMEHQTYCNTGTLKKEPKLMSPSPYTPSPSQADAKKVSINGSQLKNIGIPALESASELQLDGSKGEVNISVQPQQETDSKSKDVSEKGDEELSESSDKNDAILDLLSDDEDEEGEPAPVRTSEKAEKNVEEEVKQVEKTAEKESRKEVETESQKEVKKESQKEVEKESQKESQKEVQKKSQKVEKEEKAPKKSDPVKVEDKKEAQQKPLKKTGSVKDRLKAFEYKERPGNKDKVASKIIKERIRSKVAVKKEQPSDNVVDKEKVTSLDARSVDKLEEDDPSLAMDRLEIEQSMDFIPTEKNKPTPEKEKDEDPSEVQEDDQFEDGGNITEVLERLNTSDSMNNSFSKFDSSGGTKKKEFTAALPTFNRSVATEMWLNDDNDEEQEDVRCRVLRWMIEDCEEEEEGRARKLRSAFRAVEKNNEDRYRSIKIRFPDLLPKMAPFIEVVTLRIVPEPQRKQYKWNKPSWVTNSPLKTTRKPKGGSGPADRPYASCAELGGSTSSLMDHSISELEPVEHGTPGSQKPSWATNSPLKSAGKKKIDLFQAEIPAKKAVTLEDHTAPKSFKSSWKNTSKPLTTKTSKPLGSKGSSSSSSTGITEKTSSSFDSPVQQKSDEVELLPGEIPWDAPSSTDAADAEGAEPRMLTRKHRERVFNRKDYIKRERERLEKLDKERLAILNSLDNCDDDGIEKLPGEGEGRYSPEPTPPTITKDSVSQRGFMSMSALPLS